MKKYYKKILPKRNINNLIIDFYKEIIFTKQ